MRYPGRLHHSTPDWVGDGCSFHIRLRAAREQLTELTYPKLGLQLLRGVRAYHELGRWWCELFLLMPDHAHAILAFPAGPGMSRTIGDWKGGATRFHDVRWQDGFFDHRLRNQAEAQLKWSYIRRNPVVKGLCRTEDEWKWWWSGSVPNQLLGDEF